MAFKTCLSGRAACHQDAAPQNKTLNITVFNLSTATRRTSKKPNPCGLQPVAGNAEMEAKT